MNKHRPDDSVGSLAAPCWQYTAIAVTIMESRCSDTDSAGVLLCSHRIMIDIIVLVNKIVAIKLYQILCANGVNISLPNTLMSLVVRKKKIDLRIL